MVDGEVPFCCSSRSSSTPQGSLPRAAKSPTGWDLRRPEGALFETWRREIASTPQARLHSAIIFEKVVPISKALARNSISS